MRKYKKLTFLVSGKTPALEKRVNALKRTCREARAYLALCSPTGHLVIRGLTGPEDKGVEPEKEVLAFQSPWPPPDPAAAERLRQLVEAHDMEF